jgi:hypothetical protein
LQLLLSSQTNDHQVARVESLRGFDSIIEFFLQRVQTQTGLRSKSLPVLCQEAEALAFRRVGCSTPIVP